MKKIFLILVMVLFTAGMAASATEAEIKALETKAQQSDIAAQRELGGAYIEEALKLYQRAADRGYAAAQYVMGRMYMIWLILITMGIFIETTTAAAKRIWL